MLLQALRDGTDVALERLRAVQSASTVVHDRRLGQVHRLRARVEAAPCDDAVVFYESGVWSDGRRTSNTLSWRADGALLALVHLRRGHDAPVALAMLAPVWPTRWTSRSPHLCAHDCYVGSLRIDLRTVALRWRVTGPAKDMTITTLYS